MKSIFLIIFILFYNNSCIAQTNEEIIKKTANSVLKIIETNYLDDFKNLIGVELKIIGKDEEMLEKDFIKCKSLYDKYLKDKKSEILVTDDYDFLGRRKVIIPFFKGNDTANNISSVDLNLYFGPPQFVPLNKISNYELVVQKIKEDIILLKPPIKN